MAVVFISPKQRQKVFFMGITIIFLLFLIAVAFVVFLSKPKEASQTLVFNKPKVSINLKVFESEQFKNLQPFEEMQMQFSYSAVTKQGKQVTGFISAVSLSDAQKILEGMGFSALSVEEAEIGRDNPFTPYYQEEAVAPAESN